MVHENQQNSNNVQVNAIIPLKHVLIAKDIKFNEFSKCFVFCCHSVRNLAVSEGRGKP